MVHDHTQHAVFRAGSVIIAAPIARNPAPRMAPRYRPEDLELAVRRAFEAAGVSAPAARAVAEVLVEADDRVAWQRIHRGTHTASFAGIPASGRELVWRDMIVSRFEDARIAEEWAISDLAERMLAGR